MVTFTPGLRIPGAQRSRTPPRALRGVSAPLLSILALVTVLILPDYYTVAGTDYGGYFNDGRLLNLGLLPYRDFFEHKAPGIFVFLALWQRVFGSGWVSAKASVIPIYALFGFALYLFGKQVLRRPRLALGGSLFAVYLVLRLGFDPKRHGAILALSTSLELLSLALLVVVIESSHPTTGRRQLFLGALAGAAAVLAVLVRQSSVLPFIVLPLWSLERLLRRQPVNRLVIVGFLAGSLALAGVVALAGAVLGLQAAEVYRQVVAFNLGYVAFWAGNQPLRRLNAMLLADWPLWIGAGALWLLFIRTRRGGQSPLRPHPGLLLGCLVISLACTASGIKGMYFYRVQYLPYLALAFVTVLTALGSRLRQPCAANVALALLGLLLLGLEVRSVAVQDARTLNAWYRTASYYHFDPARFPDQATAGEVRRLTRQRRIFVYGDRAWVYLLSDTLCVNRYYYCNGVFKKGYLSPAQFARLLARFQAAPPEVVVRWPNAPSSSAGYADARYLAAFDTLIAARYRLYREIPVDRAWPYSGPTATENWPGPVRIYLLKGAPAYPAQRPTDRIARKGTKT